MAAAANDIVLCKTIFLLLSVCTKTTGEAEVKSLNMGSFDKRRKSFSSWYLQQGSHCQERV